MLVVVVVEDDGGGGLGGGGGGGNDNRSAISFAFNGILIGSGFTLQTNQSD